MVQIKDRNKLALHFTELGFNLGAEIGVASGNYSATLCQSNPDLKLFCVDMWDLNPSRYPGLRNRKHKQAIQMLAPYNCQLIKAFSTDAVRQFENESLDFVYIDANHSFDNFMRDLIDWGRKVRRGGIIAGHDYGEAIKDGVDVYAKWHRREVFVTQKPTKRGHSWWIDK